MVVDAVGAGEEDDGLLNGGWMGEEVFEEGEEGDEALFGGGYEVGLLELGGGGEVVFFFFFFLGVGGGGGGEGGVGFNVRGVFETYFAEALHVHFHGCGAEDGRAAGW